MALRRIAPALLLIAVIAAACGGSDEDSGITVDKPIGAPQQRSNYGDSGNSDSGPSVAKTASVEVDVAQNKLNSAAQAVVDLATGAKVGGFLVSSIVDRTHGHGAGNVVVKVPASRFEQVVGGLEAIGEVTRQRLQGQDLTTKYLATSARLQLARSRAATLSAQLDRSDDSSEKFDLRESLTAARNDLHRLQRSESYVAGQTAYSTIAVSLIGKEPPAGPEKPAFVRALATAKNISLAIASGIVLAAGVIVPIGLLLLILYLVGAPIFRRLKPRLES